MADGRTFSGRVNSVETSYLEARIDAPEASSPEDSAHWCGICYIKGSPVVAVRYSDTLEKLCEEAMLHLCSSFPSFHGMLSLFSHEGTFQDHQLLSRYTIEELAWADFEWLTGGAETGTWSPPAAGLCMTDAREMVSLRCHERDFDGMSQWVVSDPARPGEYCLQGWNCGAPPQKFELQPGQNGKRYIRYGELCLVVQCHEDKLYLTDDWAGQYLTISNSTGEVDLCRDISGSALEVVPVPHGQKSFGVAAFASNVVHYGRALALAGSLAAVSFLSQGIARNDAIASSMQSPSFLHLQQEVLGLLGKRVQSIDSPLAAQLTASLSRPPHGVTDTMPDRCVTYHNVNDSRDKDFAQGDPVLVRQGDDWCEGVVRGVRVQENKVWVQWREQLIFEEFGFDSVVGIPGYVRQSEAQRVQMESATNTLLAQMGRLWEEMTAAKAEVARLNVQLECASHQALQHDSKQCSKVPCESPSSSAAGFGTTFTPEEVAGLSLLPTAETDKKAAAFLKDGPLPFRCMPLDGYRVLDVPVKCLRWTHNGINSNFQPSDGSGDLSIFDTAEAIWRAGPQYWKRGLDIPNLHVVMDSQGRLWSLSNRRLASFRMAQSLTNETLLVRCFIYRKHGKFVRGRSLTTTNDGTGVRPNFNGRTTHHVVAEQTYTHRY